MWAGPIMSDRASASIEGTLANREGGWGQVIGCLLVITVLILPMTWAMPLFRTELLVFLTNEVTVLGAVRTLARTDFFLCAIVVSFGMIVPLTKLSALLYAWFILPCPRASIWIERLSMISKFSMLDVMLIAITIVGLKGVGLGKVEIEYGFYIYSTVVISILILSSWMQVKGSAGKEAAALDETVPLRNFDARKVFDQTGRRDDAAADQQSAGTPPTRPEGLGSGTSVRKPHPTST
jgi:paraquat-inducible protein A